MQVHRMELKLGVVIVMGVDKEGTQFMDIEMFVNQCNKVLLGVKDMQVVEYNAHFHSWVIQVHTEGACTICKYFHQTSTECSSHV